MRSRRLQLGLAAGLSCWLALGCGRLRHEARDGGRDANVPASDAPLAAGLDGALSIDAQRSEGDTSRVDAFVVPGADAFAGADVLSGADAFEARDTFTRTDAFAGSDAASDWASLDPYAYYPLDGTGEDLAYASGALDCTTCSWVPGRRGSAVVLEGTRVPDRPRRSDDYTVSVWARWPTMFPGSFSGCGIVLTERTSLEADDEPTRVLGYAYGGGLTLSSGAVPSETWVHVVLVYRASGGSGELWVDGARVSIGGSAMPDSLVGARLSGSMCGMQLDDVFLFDRALDPSEIAQLRAL
ncbi:MAG: hypothetical protein J0L92_11655 [Deltaproteobacteria bacterium]|nr:hypothetical protein [Deltaproteobacteria bacterium]